MDGGSSPETIDSSGTLPLHYAVASGHQKSIECLLNGGLLSLTPIFNDPLVGSIEAADGTGQTSLHLTSLSNNSEIASCWKGCVMLPFIFEIS